MQWMYIVIGGLVGLWFGSASYVLLGFAAGAAFGYLLEQIRSLEDKVRRLNARVERAVEARDVREPAARAPEAERPAAPPLPETPATPRVSRPVAKKIQEPAASRTAKPSPVTPKTPDLFDRLVEMAKEWLTTGNVPVKVGVIVSFFGVAFLLKYAVDQGYIVISIEARYLAVTAAAAVLLGLGWRLREKLPVYALSLQGGGIGILYLFS
jgi:uncharacterized membrane protein